LAVLWVRIQPVVFNALINELLITRKEVANIIFFDKQFLYRKKFVNPNPGGLVANMTYKTQNCCDKFIIHKKLKKFAILHKKAFCV
jgi:hypothetical protein